MRKTFIIYSGILIFLYLLLSWAGSHDEYQAEKKLWQLDARLQQIDRDHLAVTEFAVEHLKRDYLALIQDNPFPGFTRKANISLARIYMLGKKYQRARELLETLVQDGAASLEVKMKALTEIIISYSLESDSEGIIKTYRRIMDLYPFTPEGINAPLMIAKFYSDNNQFDEANESLDEAIEYYSKRLTQKLPSDTMFFILHKLVICYQAKKEWEDVFDVLNQIFEKYPDQVFKNIKTPDDILQTVKSIALSTPENYESSGDLYQGFIERQARHPLTKALQASLIALEDFKEQKEEQEKESNK